MYIFRYIYIYIYILLYIYIFIYTKPRNRSRACATFLKNRRMLTKPSKFHRILTPFCRNVDLDL